MLYYSETKPSCTALPRKTARGRGERLPLTAQVGAGGKLPRLLRFRGCWGGSLCCLGVLVTNCGTLTENFVRARIRRSHMHTGPAEMRDCKPRHNGPVLASSSLTGSLRISHKGPQNLAQRTSQTSRRVCRIDRRQNCFLASAIKMTSTPQEVVLLLLNLQIDWSPCVIHSIHRGRVLFTLAASCQDPVSNSAFYIMTTKN